MNYRQATHVIEPSFLGFPMNLLATEGDALGDVFGVANFPLFVKLIVVWWYLNMIFIVLI